MAAPKEIVGACSSTRILEIRHSEVLLPGRLLFPPADFLVQGAEFCSFGCAAFPLRFKVESLSFGV